MTKQSPWRNPMVWLVAGIPAASIVAGVGLVIVATRQPNDAITDKVRRTAQIQVADVGADATARNQGLRAVLRVADGRLEALPAAGEFDRNQPLTLLLRHPSEAARDVRQRLVPSDTGWRTDYTLDTAHDWNVELTSFKGDWRLVGRLPRGQQAVALQPALAAR